MQEPHKHLVDAISLTGSGARSPKGMFAAHPSHNGGRRGWKRKQTKRQALRAAEPPRTPDRGTVPPSDESLATTMHPQMGYGKWPRNCIVYAVGHAVCPQGGLGKGDRRPPSEPRDMQEQPGLRIGEAQVSSQEVLPETGLV